MTNCPFITQTLRNILVRCVPRRLRPSTRHWATLTASYLDLLLSIRKEFNFALPFRTNVTISISISKRNRSSPAYGVFISHLLRSARACSSFQCVILKGGVATLSFLGRDMSKKIWNHLLRSSMVNTDVIKQYEVLLSRMLHDILEQGQMQSIYRHYTNV